MESSLVPPNFSGIYGKLWSGLLWKCLEFKMTINRPRNKNSSKYSSIGSWNGKRDSSLHSVSTIRQLTRRKIVLNLRGKFNCYSVVTLDQQFSNCIPQSHPSEITERYRDRYQAGGDSEINTSTSCMFFFLVLYTENSYKILLTWFCCKIIQLEYCYYNIWFFMKVK